MTQTTKGRKKVPAKPIAGSRPQGGRPTVYSEELREIICSRLAMGETLNEICKTDGMPDERRVREWAMDPEHPFAVHYDRARLVGYHRMADDLLLHADDKSKDWTEKETKGGSKIKVVDETAISRSRLQVDARKWLLSKMLPKIYGDKIEVGGKDGGPIQIAHNHAFTDMERARRLTLMLFEQATIEGNAEPDMMKLLSGTTITTESST
jgi:hypothetical protein